MRDSDGGVWSATTRFDQFSHGQLVDMVNGSAPASVSSIANTLNSASTQIQSMADDLNTHITHLQWDGAAGDSFRTWGRQVVQAMDELATFHNNAGLAMQTAGDTLSSVKAAMPPVPTTDVATVDAFVRQASTTITPQPVVMNGRVLPPVGLTQPALPGQISQSDAYAAQGRVDAAHQEAIAQMEKLGGAYNGATQTMDVNQEPKFPPTPGKLMPPRGSGYHGSQDVGGPGGGGSSTGSVGGGGQSGRFGSHTGHAGGGGAVGGGAVHAPKTPGGPGAGSTLQGVHPPTAGPGPVHVPGGPAGSGHGGSTGGGGGHAPGGGVVAPPPVDGRGPTGGIPGSSVGRRGRQPGTGPGEPGTHEGVTGGRSGGSRGFGGKGAGLGGATESGHSLRGAAESGRGIVGGEANGTGGAGAESSTARSGLARESAASGDGLAGAGSGEAAGGQMMGGGMGGMGGATGRGRSRSGRAAYLAEDEGTWTAPSTGNPAVIE